jgi:hypothetical protein
MTIYLVLRSYTFITKEAAAANNHRHAIALSPANKEY